MKAWRRNPIHSNSIEFDSSDLLKDDLLMVGYLLLQSKATMIRSGIYHMSRMTMFLEGGICNELRHSMSRCDRRDRCDMRDRCDRSCDRSFDRTGKLDDLSLSRRIVSRRHKRRPESSKVTERMPTCYRCTCRE